MTAIQNKIIKLTLFIFLLDSISCSSIVDNKIVFPLKYVDPFICTEGDNGQLYPGASYPFGMVQLSPETEGTSHVGYYYEDQYIEGFSHLRIAGGGSKGKGGGLLIKPGIGTFTNKIDEFREKYIKSSEEASAGYYKTELASRVKVELTVTPRAGFHRYTFPEAKKQNRYAVVDLSHSYVGILDANLHVKNNSEITGMIESLHNNGGGYHKLYFAILSDVPFSSYTSWSGTEIQDNQPDQQGNQSGVWLRFPESGKNVVQLKVGLSPVSAEEALKAATIEIKDWNFDEVRNETAQVWREKLSKIEIKGGTDEFKTLFYTHLYHSYLVPNISSSLNGTYRAPHQPDSLYNTKVTAPDFNFYSTWSIWDDFRKYALVSLLEPEIDKNIARSLVDYYKHRAGGDPKYWPTPNIRMEFSEVVIMNACAMGLGDFDREAAFKGMMENFENSGAKNVSDKLEKSYQAYAVMKMAEALGKTEEAEKLKEAALDYRSDWCADQKDNQGNVRGFFTPDGKPVPDVEEFEKYVYEGNLWHYRWFVLHDVQGVIDLRGGRDKLSDDLEYFFDHDLYMHVNEPDYQAPFLFDYLGKPYLTQKWARAFTTKDVTQLYENHGLLGKPHFGRIYRADPKGYIESMDDDAGAMSSWFVMSAMGLFPYDPVEPYMVIGSPIFPEMIIHLDKGKDFKIIAKNVSEENFYIQSAKLNGEEWNRPWIKTKTLLEGGTLEFTMGNKPNVEWGSDPADAPPNM